MHRRLEAVAESRCAKSCRSIGPASSYADGCRPARGGSQPWTSPRTNACTWFAGRANVSRGTRFEPQGRARGRCPGCSPARARKLQPEIREESGQGCVSRGSTSRWKEKLWKRKTTKGRNAFGPASRLWSLSPLDVQSALTDAAAVSHGEFSSMCVNLITANQRSSCAALATKEGSAEFGNSQTRTKSQKRSCSKSSATHLVHERQVVVIRRHREHQPMLEVQRNLVRVPVLANQRVQRVAVGHLQTKRSVIF